MIAIIPFEIAGYGAGLVQGFHENGLRAWQIDLTQAKFKYPQSELPMPLNWLVKISRRFRSIPGVIGKLLSVPVNILLCLVLCSRCETIVCMFGSSLLPLELDLRIYRHLGIKTIMVYLGSDSRPDYLSSESVDKFEENGNIGNLISKLKVRKKRITKIGSLVDHVIDNPISGLLHEDPILNWFKIGFPVRVGGEVDSHLTRSNNFKIIHCPTNRKIKGSDEIASVIDELVLEGYPIDYVEITNVTRDEVLVAIANADLAIDQLYSDTPLAGFATECATLGTPVIVGSLSKDVVVAHFAKLELEIPSVFISPNELKSTIVDIMGNPDKIKKIADRARQFVLSNWTPYQVANRYIRILGGNIDGFHVNPCDVSDAGGNGLSEDRLSNAAVSVYDTGGEQAYEIKVGTFAHNCILQRINR